MPQPTRPVFQPLGYATVLVAALFLLLYGMNLRSRFYYHGPDYGFLFWWFAWAASASIGLMLQRRWAVVLLFFPGIAFSVVLCTGIVKSSRIDHWVILLNAVFVSLTLAGPIALLRFWRS